jgi:predicted transcriptional regulator
MKQAADVEIPADVLRRLDALSRRTQRPMSDIATEALSDYLDARDAAVQEPELFVSNATVLGWLKTWGTADETDAPVADIRKPS